MLLDSRDVIDRVFTAVDAEPDWSAELTAQLVRIPAVNPKFPVGNAGAAACGQTAGAALNA